MGKFDIYWAPYIFQESKLKNKNELNGNDAKVRPVLILDNDIFVKVSKITSKQARNDATEYTIIDWEAAGLNSPSVIRFSKQDLIKSSDIPEGNKIGHLSDKDIQNIKQSHLVESLQEELSDNPSPEIGPEMGLSSLIISAINGEWNTIDEYNQLVAIAEQEGYQDIVNVINDINAEENTHIGQLQQLLKTLSSNTDKIGEGEQEAEEQLNEI